MYIRAILTLFLACLAGILPAQDGGPGEDSGNEVHSEIGIMVEMRDGVRLATDLFLPANATGKLPTVMWRTVYSKQNAWQNEPLIPELIAHGYAVVFQETRGRGDSEGDFIPTVGDRNDGYDTVSWISSQPWSNQKVGTAGCSALGEVQLLLGATRHPNHVTSIPKASASGYNIRGRPWASFDGGVLELAQTAGWFSVDQSKVDYWTIPIIDILKNAGLGGTEYENFASSNPAGEYYRNLEWIQPGDVIDVPMLFFDSWYDYGAAETMELVNALKKDSPGARARDNQFVIIAPGTHCSYPNATEHTLVGNRDVGDARLDVIQLELSWFDFWLKGIDNGVTDRPKIQYYVMGLNRWQYAEAWPIPGTRFEKLYLDSDGQANSLQGNGRLTFAAPVTASTDRFVYDPANPVPSLGGQACCTGSDTESGAYDQSKIELRDDVLVYTSGELETGIEVTGPLEVVLQVSSSAPDTDFTAKLVDVYPDGRAFNVQEGALRMRYREGFDKDLRMTPGATVTARLSLHATSNWFGPGHRIRLEISSSNFPRWDRNLNTGGNNYDESEWAVAENAVHHSAEQPSYILLPIVE